MSHNHLRRYRKRGKFTQAELAYLLGIENGVAVSRYETLTCTPSLPTAVAYEVLFDIPVCELFPMLYRTAETDIFARVRQLLETLEASPEDPNAILKMQVLHAIIARDRRTITYENTH